MVCDWHLPFPKTSLAFCHLYRLGREISKPCEKQIVHAKYQNNKLLTSLVPMHYKPALLSILSFVFYNLVRTLFILLIFSHNQSLVCYSSSLFFVIVVVDISVYHLHWYLLFPSFLFLWPCSVALFQLL